jgi:hypothetical protein
MHHHVRHNVEPISILNALTEAGKYATHWMTKEIGAEARRALERLFLSGDANYDVITIAGIWCRDSHKIAELAVERWNGVYCRSAILAFEAECVAARHKCF